MPGLSAATHFDIPTMIFIDGGYLKNWIRNECKIKDREYHFGSLLSYIASNAFPVPNRRLQVIRNYFYDGLADSNYPKHAHQKEFQDYLENTFDNFEVKTSYLKKKSEGFTQKSVDTLLAIEMLDKAISNQYEIAILIAGDLDHYEAVKAVKAKGKQVFGVYYEKSKADDLIRIFDRSYALNKDMEGTYKRQ